MANRCATLAEFLAVVTECETVGPNSEATLRVASLPSPGDTFDVIDESTAPPTIGRLTATAGAPGVDEFQIGGDASATATNIKNAISAAANAVSNLVTATVLDDTVYLASVGTGPSSLLTLATSVPAKLVFSSATLLGGDSLVLFYLDSACEMINLECWGEKASTGHIYLTGHYCTAAQGAEAGTINRKKIDRLEVGYNSPGANPRFSYYDSTKWGRLYNAMRKTLPVLPVPGRQYLYVC